MSTIATDAIVRIVAADTIERIEALAPVEGGFAIIDTILTQAGARVDAARALHEKLQLEWDRTVEDLDDAAEYALNLQIEMAQDLAAVESAAFARIRDTAEALRDPAALAEL
ncbi:hypothetical protein [Cellulomonas iranensis]|uniref:hypothetical protein n=1 Tax=Cellulomonas iranensis TaxID=76862 RepID=UPI000B3D0069|nr:hypothetical protein [Cellulomonas iranensis]